MDLGRERAIAQKYVNDLDIQAKSIYQEVQYLSGGNRQKVMLSKWLGVDSKSSCWMSQPRA